MGKERVGDCDTASPGIDRNRGYQSGAASYACK